MKRTFGHLVLIAILCTSCNGSKAQIDQSPMTPPIQNTTSEQTIVISQSELVDRTIQEAIAESLGYDGGNGTVLERKEGGGRLEILRKFDQTFSAKDYAESSERNLYLGPNRETIVYSFPKDSGEKLVSSQLWVSSDADGKNVESWINVISSTNHKGWLFVGNRDPYEDENWLLVGTVIVGGKTLHLRKYTHWFSTARGEQAYDRPSLEESVVVWKAERTEDNDQINLEPIEVAEETFPGKYWSEHWVKVKDSHGRIGWFPGDKLSIERGGFMYLSPENIVNYAFSDE